MKKGKIEMTEEKKLTKASEELEGISGIFLAEYEMNNMTMERIIVSNPAILAILEVTQISEDMQEEAVNKLVDRTQEWSELETEEQVNKIKAVLTQETVLAYLVEKDVIRKKCDMVQIAVDLEGSIVIEAYYTKLNREQRRMIDRQMSEAERKKIDDAVNIFSGDDTLIERAKKKISELEGTKKNKVVSMDDFKK